MTHESYLESLQEKYQFYKKESDATIKRVEAQITEWRWSVNSLMEFPLLSKELSHSNRGEWLEEEPEDKCGTIKVGLNAQGEIVYEFEYKGHETWGYIKYYWRTVEEVLELWLNKKGALEVCSLCTLVEEQASWYGSYSEDNRINSVFKYFYEEKDLVSIQYYWVNRPSQTGGSTYRITYNDDGLLAEIRQQQGHLTPSKEEELGDLIFTSEKLSFDALMDFIVAEMLVETKELLLAANLDDAIYAIMPCTLTSAFNGGFFPPCLFISIDQERKERGLADEDNYLPGKLRHPWSNERGSFEGEKLIDACQHFIQKCSMKEEWDLLDKLMERYSIELRTILPDIVATTPDFIVVPYDAETDSDAGFAYLMEQVYSAEEIKEKRSFGWLESKF